MDLCWIKNANSIPIGKYATFNWVLRHRINKTTIVNMYIAPTLRQSQSCSTYDVIIMFTFIKI